MKRISPGIIFIRERKHSPQRGEEEETLPVSVEGARDVERVRTAFVVSSGAKSIHKAAVGKRGLHKETEQRGRERKNKHTMRQQFVHSTTAAQAQVQNVSLGVCVCVSLFLTGIVLPCVMQVTATLLVVFFCFVF